MPDIDNIKSHYPTIHGLSKTATYKRWKSVRQRTGLCKGKNAKWYNNVTMCSGWSDFETFLADMGEPPTPQHQIDRISNAGGYWCGHCVECASRHHPLNCRWATSKQQNRNRQNNRIIHYNNESLCAAEWAERFHIPYKTFHRALQRGYSIDEIRMRLKPLAP